MVTLAAIAKITRICGHQHVLANAHCGVELRLLTYTAFRHDSVAILVFILTIRN